MKKNYGEKTREADPEALSYQAQESASHCKRRRYSLVRMIISFPVDAVCDKSMVRE